MHVKDLVPTKDQLITREYYRTRNALGTAPLGFAPPGSQSLQVRGTDTTATSDAAVQSGTTNTSSNGGSSVGSALTSSNGVFPPQTDVVLSAPDIDWTYAVIERLNEDSLTTSLIPFNPGKLFLENDTSQNLALLPGDIVTFFSTADLKVPTTQQTRFVRLEGEFVASGIYSVEPGETLRHLLMRAGGFTADAYLYGSEFTRQSTKRVQQQRLNEFADSVQSQIATQSATSNAKAVSALDAQAIQASTDQGNQIVARLRQIQPIGRIVLELKPDSRGIEAVPDLPLEDGDRFVVPRVPSTVAVEGQVYSANAFVFVRGRKEKDYLRQAGGPDRNADKKRVFILRADGSVFSHQYGDVDHATMFPGDTIVVPPNLDRRAILRNLVDISQVVGGLGLGIAAIDLLR
jgi:protein involved in polysaccharide export with SLBB domain